MSTFQIYKSSAGSGKTTALIQTFLKLSLNSDNAAQFKKILAVTFTNKAAAEMKERLIEELDSLSKLRSDYDGSKFMVNILMVDLNIPVETLARRAAAMFKRVLHDYNNLSIGTIDQFNHRLIRSFSRDLNLKTDFEVELQEVELFAEAVNRLLEKVGRDSFITDHLIAYTQFKLEDEKRANLNQDLADLRQLVTSDEGIKALKSMSEINWKNPENTRKKLQALRDSSANTIRNKGIAMLELLTANEIAPLDLLGGKTGIGKFILEVSKFPERKPNLEAKSVEHAREGRWIAKSANPYVRERVELLEPELSRHLEMICESFQSPGSDYFLSEALLQKIHLIAILDELDNCLDAICDERNILPISRFNKIISDALRQEPVAFLYEHYGTRFNHILIDEYQDTSELQWFNILPLIDETLAKGKSSLVVGDAKQSIYRWRGGKAEQLITLPELIDAPPDLKAGIAANLNRNAETHVLNTNYRSKPNIVQFNNALFSFLGSLVTQENSLYRQEYLTANVSQKWLKSKSDDGYVQIDYLGEKVDIETNSALLIDNIQQFKAKGYAYGEMAILVRSKKTGIHFMEALYEAGIPVSTADNFEVDRDLHVKLIIAMLRLSIDTANSPAKIEVMRCLEQHRGFEFNPGKYMRSSGNNYRNKIDLDQYLTDHHLPNHKFISKGKGVFDRAESLISAYLPDENNFFINGFLNMLIAKVGINGSTYDFFEWWDSLVIKPGIPEPTDVDAVRLLTIHKSKGLQFKVVFVPNATWKRRAGYRDLKWFDLKKFPNQPLDFAPLALNSRLIEQGLKDEWAADELANDFDNLNLIYVALTRAVDALCIAFDKGGNDTDKREGGLSTTGFWMVKALESFDTAMLKKFEGVEKEEFENGSLRLSIGKIPKAELTKKSFNSTGDIEWATRVNRSWTENVRIAPIEKSKEQVRGIWFHRIVAFIHSTTDIEPELQKLAKSGELNSVEIENLGLLLNTLYSDAKFLALRRNAQILAERELFYQGQVLRPDLVFESQERLSVIDFKTGGEEPEHIEQVARYAEAIQNISTKSVEAFLIYTDPYFWKEVGASKNGQPRLF